MIKIQDIVKDIVYKDEEALSAISSGYMNYSQYAKIIQQKVEKDCKKKVSVPSIVVTLSRLSKALKKNHPLVQDIKIKNITSKTPLSEIVYNKTSENISKLSKIYDKVKTGTDDFFTMTLSTMEITVICSDRIKEKVEKEIKEKPNMIVKNLASIGLSLDPKYYPLPNITFSLIRRIAQKRIPLAETITTRTEVIFVFNQKYLATMTDLFIER